jgi:hypothetical protein
MTTRLLDHTFQHKQKHGQRRSHDIHVKIHHIKTWYKGRVHKTTSIQENLSSEHDIKVHRA